MFRSLVYSEINKELIAEMHQLIVNSPKAALNEKDSMLFDLPIHYKIKPIDEVQYQKFVFRDTLFFDNIMQRYQPYRTLTFQTTINDKAWQFSISKSLYISDELIEKVAIATLILSLILLIGVYVFNSYFFSKIWKNFFNTVQVIKNYDISNKNEIVLPKSEIQEFALLNQGFMKMHTRIKQDYQNLKEFIENISHEIQTPLAIIKSKIDLMLQNENMDKTQLEQIQSIQNSAIRLSNLNKSLILLSRIDNNQFSEKVNVNVPEIIDIHLANFEDIIQSKEIFVQKNYKNTLVVSADAGLITIMILNLLKNAVYHNIPSGIIDITITSKELIIKNSGKELEIVEDDLFKRFTKSSNRKDSLGLGLAIVKKICDLYNFRIQYTYKESQHCISINFY